MFVVVAGMSVVVSGMFVVVSGMFVVVSGMSVVVSVMFAVVVAMFVVVAGNSNFCIFSSPFSLKVVSIVMYGVNLTILYDEKIGSKHKIRRSFMVRTASR